MSIEEERKQCGKRGQSVSGPKQWCRHRLKSMKWEMEQVLLRWRPDAARETVHGSPLLTACPRDIYHLFRTIKLPLRLTTIPQTYA